jgi:preprotein translocase subunit SecD
MKRTRIILPLAVALAVTALAVLGAGCGSTRTGGSVERSTNALTFELRLRSERPLSASEMSRAVTVMNTRLQRLGVGDFGLHVTGASGISLRFLPDEKKPSRLASVVGSTGLLQIFDLEPSLVRGASSASDAPRPRALYELLDSVRTTAERDGGSGYYLFDRRHELVAGPALKPGLLPAPGAGPAPGDEVLGVPNGTELVSCDLATSQFCPNETGGFAPKPKQTWYYLFRLPPQLSNDDLKRASIRAFFDAANASPEITFNLTGSGNAKIREITRLEWRRGSAQGRPQHVAFVVDGRLITFPQIDPGDPSLSDGIDASISGVTVEGFHDLSQAKDLAVVLRAGPLPASFHVLSSRTITTR